MDKTLLDKIRSSYNEPIIGNVIYSKEETDEIYNYVSRFLSPYSKSREYKIPLTAELNLIMFTAMVNAAKSWEKDDSKFWDHICNIFIGEKCSQKIYDYFTAVIDNLLIDKKILSPANHKKYYASICLSALTPQTSIYSFFDLCWDIYSKDFGCRQGSENDISYISEQLKKRFENNKDKEDGLSLGSSVYSIRIGLKSLATEYPSLMKDFLLKTFEYIDECHNRRNIDISSSYHAFLLKTWWNNKEFGKYHESDNDSTVIVDRKNIHISYVYVDGNPFIHIPSIRVNEGYDNNPYITVYCGNEIAYSEELSVIGSGLFWRSEKKLIPVTDIWDNYGINNIKVIIDQSGKELCNTGKYLEREYLLFQNKREILSKICLPGNYTLFTSNIEKFSELPANISYISGYRYVFTACEEESLCTPDKTIYFEKEESDHEVRVSTSNRIRNVSFRIDDTDYYVIDGNLKVIINSSINPSSIGIRYDNDVFRLCDFTCKETSNGTEYRVTEMIPVGEPKTITVFDYSNNRRLKTYNIIKFKNINITYDKPLYYDISHSIGEVHFKTEKYDEKANFHINDDEVVIDLGVGRLVFNPPVLRWRFEEGEWNTQFFENCWYENIANNSKLELLLPEGFTGKLYLLQTYEEIPSENTDSYVYKIGSKIYSFFNNTDFPSMLTLFFQCTFQGASKAENLMLANIIMKEDIHKPNELIFWSEKIKWIPENNYIGSDSKRFTINVYKNNIFLHTTKVSTSNCDIDCDISAPGIYKVEIYNQGKAWSLGSKITESEHVVGNIAELRFINKTILLKAAITTDEPNPIRLRKYYIDQIEVLSDNEDSTYYKGMLYYYDNDNNKKYINYISSPGMEREKINPVRIELKDDTHLWLVYGLNNDDPNDFTSEFTLKLVNKPTSYAGTLSIQSNNVKYIDNYYFETENENV